MPIHDIVSFESGAWQTEFDFGHARSCSDPLTPKFLRDLSARILSDRQARNHPDLATFGYFCRGANVKRSLGNIADIECRFGWGTIIHIAPSNIPINFAFSLVMGLLSGNTNIVRLPSKQYVQVDILISLIDQVLSQPDYSALAKQIVFVRTDRNSKTLNRLILKANGVIVWGGDSTVSEFKKLPKSPRCVEVYFPNRASSAAINAENYLLASDVEKTKLTRAFYNDSYLVDQNACSSPSMVFWVGDQAKIKIAQQEFWTRLGQALDTEYQLDPTARIDKSLDIMKMILNHHGPVSLEQKHDDIWLLNQSTLKTETLRYGAFLEISVPTISSIPTHLRGNEQTLTIFGLQARDILTTLASAGTMVDRIVPIGEALNIGLLWDGKDMLSLLSRKVEIR